MKRTLILLLSFISFAAYSQTGKTALDLLNTSATADMTDIFFVQKSTTQAYRLQQVYNLFSNTLETQTHASTTYAPIASLNNYLLSSTASSTYATQASLNNYLLSSTASSTYGTLTQQQNNTTAITNLQSGKLNIANYINHEVPTGSLNGSNKVFTMANLPVANSETITLNGLVLDPGTGNDYTISGATITFLFTPVATDKIRVSYIKQ